MGDESTSPASAAAEQLSFSRWWLVGAAVLAMAVVSPYQYVWSSIEGPLAARLNVSPPALGTVFTLFVVFQAASQFPVGWWRDRHGPRELTVIAAVLAGGGYMGLAYATELWQVYLLYSLGAIGVGIVYTVAVNTALKWFPDQRGLTTGAGTMAFAGGSVLFVPYVRANTTLTAYPVVLRNMGILIAVAILIAAVLLRDPPDSWYERFRDVSDAGATDGAGASHYTSQEMVRTWQFWVMYVMFIAVSGAGLMLTAKVISFAQQLDITATTATLSAMALPLAGGIGRLVLGGISDRIARNVAMSGSFILCGIGLLGIVEFASVQSSVGFIAAVVVATFFWSPQYTLFPSLVGDYYGQQNSSANYALLYSGKMWGGVFGGTITGWLVTVIGWQWTFLLGSGLAIAAGLLALVLRPPERQNTATG